MVWAFMPPRWAEPITLLREHKRVIIHDCDIERKRAQNLLDWSVAERVEHVFGAVCRGGHTRAAITVSVL